MNARQALHRRVQLALAAVAALASVVACERRAPAAPPTDSTQGGYSEILAVKAHDRGVKELRFTPDGKTLVSCGHAESVRLWSVKDGFNTANYGFETRGGATSVAISPDGNVLAAGCYDGSVIFVELATGKERVVKTGHAGFIGIDEDVAFSPLYGIAFSPDGKLLATGAADGRIKLWDADSGKNLATLKGHSHWIYSVAFSPDGRTLASASRDATVRLWDVAAHREETTLRGHTSDVRAVAFSPDGKTIATASADQTVKLWDAGSQRNLATWRAHNEIVVDLAFAQAGKSLLTGSTDGSAKLWAVPTGRELWTVTARKGVILSVAVSPDGTLLATGGTDATIRLWKAPTGRAGASKN